MSSVVLPKHPTAVSKAINATYNSALLMLEEQIISENHESIASIVVESIPGSAGVLTMPLAYMQGVRAICDKYGILLHIDEVMCGFGRTGEMWGFQTYPGVLPDIVTSAKGLSSSIAPISFVAVNERMMEFFEDNAPGWGSTFQGHPVAMAAAYANLTEMLTTNLVGHVQSVAPAFYEHMRHCAEVHPSIKGFRALGLYGALDIATPDGEQPHEVHEARTAATNKYFEATRQNGLLGLFRPPHIHIAPPLIISEEEVRVCEKRSDELKRRVHWILTCMVDTSVRTVAASKLYAVINNTMLVADPGRLRPTAPSPQRS